ncbi:MAG: hypothetical protein MUC96_30535 [Myxococcaceae bacterium]|jgi:hypothetical protein|nr:hypothetical protein [Myxococcaceae bacterium]
MSVRGVGRGGKAGGAGRAGAAGGASGPSKAGGAFGAKVDRTESLVAPSGLVGSSNVGATAATNPVVSKALDIARQMKQGQIKSRDEATKKLVQDILRDKVRSQSKHLTEKIFEQLKDDPRLAQTLERLWNKAEQEE